VALITRTAQDQFDALIDFWLSEKVKQRFGYYRYDLVANLRSAYDDAVTAIDAQPGMGSIVLPTFPRSRKINRLGYHWIKRNRYWFAYIVGTDGVPTLTGVHWDREQVPRNVSTDVDPVGDA
jgi:hypothetical protein